MKPAIGMIGVGLMGHGIAWNIAHAGHPVTLLDHAGNQPTADLRGMGAVVVPSIAEVVAASDIVILVVTGAPQVESILAGEGGVAAHLRAGMVVIDCSTSLPDVSVRMADLLAASGGRFLDAAMTRLPQHARAGTLNLLVGGEAGLLDEVRPVLDLFSESITHVGGVGAGHRMKLLHNYVSLGFMSLLGEVAAHARTAGIQPEILIDVLGKGGGGGAALDRVSPFLRTGDGSAVPFFISNAAKDLAYYRMMASSSGCYHGIADGVGQTLEAVVAAGHGQAFISQLASLLPKAEG